MSFGTAKVVFDLETAPLDLAAQFIEEPEPPANYKDPAAIQRYIVDAKAKALDRCGLDPDLARIVALGWMLEGRDTEPRVVICEDENQEAYALREFWADLRMDGGGTRRTVSYNGLVFDMPVLLRRSWYLGVLHPALNLDRYRTPHIDLYQKLSYNGAIRAHSLSFYGRRLGFDVLDSTIDGSQIAELVKAGEWEKVKLHCKSDVQLTYDLAARMSFIEVDEDEADERRKAGLVA